MRKAAVESMTDPALHGIRVLELGHAIAAPHGAQILADQGADVIRVEPPGGDRTRGALPVTEGDSLYFAAHNRRKRSVILDLKAPEGRRLFLELADTADVVITNYRAGVPERLGIGYETLRGRNPRLVYVHITGFGVTGDGRDFGAYDGVIQAMSGVPALTGHPDGPPVFVGAFVADQLAALEAALGAVLALTRRAATGAGELVEVSMLDGYLTTLAHHIGLSLDLGISSTANANQVPTAFANTFTAADGQVYIAPLAPAAWRAFCEVIDAPRWLAEAEPRWRIEAGRDQAERFVSGWTSTRTREEIVMALRAAGVPCGPVNSVAEAVRDPVHRGRSPITTVRMPSDRRVHVPAPELRLGDGANGACGADEPAVPEAGQHTAEVLAELGYGAAERDRLQRTGVAQ